MTSSGEKISRRQFVIVGSLIAALAIGVWAITQMTRSSSKPRQVKIDQPQIESPDAWKQPYRQTVDFVGTLPEMTRRHQDFVDRYARASDAIWSMSAVK